MKLSLGSDPELMLVEHSTGNIVSSMRVLDGRTKHKPIDLGSGIKMYADNALIEASFPPLESPAQAAKQMGIVFSRMQAKLGKKFGLVPKAAHVYDKKELDCKEVWESGCNPNYDVYRRSMNLPADFKDGLRTGSFHVHVGAKELMGMDEKEDAIKLLDIFLGVPSVIFDRDETAGERRKLYGKAGEFRPTPYGIEYRVLGNWPLRSPETTELCFDLVEYAMNLFHNRKDILSEVKSEDVEKAINEGDKDLAAAIIGKAGFSYSWLVRVAQAYKIPQFEKAWGI